MKETSNIPPKDEFASDGPEQSPSDVVVKVIRNSAFDESKYEALDRFEPTPNPTFKTARTVSEAISAIAKDPKIEVEARVLAVKEGKVGYRKLTREKFLEAVKKGPGRVRFKENNDPFATDAHFPNVVGDDYVPLLGGPFNKQLYIYDFLKQEAQCFFAYNHDPVAKAFVEITKEFTLGRGFRVDSKDERALAIWRAFEEVNNLQEMMDYIATQISVDGEIMLWWLPNKQTKIGWQLGPGQEVPKGFLPRVRMMDPSSCWEIVTFPEDITRVLYYQFVFPTQYQIYTAPGVPTSKFIFQQIASPEMDHFRINSYQNEKRGRSDLFSALGYLKRLRDSVNYEIIASQKCAAYAIDTTIEGSQTDINNYIQAQNNGGTIHPAGSEFVHTSKIKREYQGVQGTSRGGENNSFNWALNMACMAVRIPVSYLGTHLSGGTTRASALVATEPVAKKFESRQQVYEKIVKKMWNRVIWEWAGIKADCEVTFPEIITQDRSAKIKDIKIAEDAGYISRKRAATTVAKELGFGDYEYDSERVEIEKENPPPLSPTIIAPLTAPASDSGGDFGSNDPEPKPSAVTGEERRKVAMNQG